MTENLILILLYHSEITANDDDVLPTSRRRRQLVCVISLTCLRRVEDMKKSAAARPIFDRVSAVHRPIFPQVKKIEKCYVIGRPPEDDRPGADDLSSTTRRYFQEGKNRHDCRKILCQG